MAQNIKINGVTYNSVSSLSIPLNTGGGNAVFPDTSDANAKAADIATGKTAYVNGSKVTGTATGGGGGLDLPSGYQLSQGTYTPSTEGTNVLHSISIASATPFVYGHAPCFLFCIYRADGFIASGSASRRYLTYYCGTMPCTSDYTLNVTYGGGMVWYRNLSASEATFASGVESASGVSYGLPPVADITRSNCFVRCISSGILTFSSYGTTTLESGQTYNWYAVLSPEATL